MKREIVILLMSAMLTSFAGCVAEKEELPAEETSAPADTAQSAATDADCTA